MKLDNPAARLLNVLEEGKKMPDNANCRGVWEKLLGVTQGDRALLIGRMGKLMALATDIVEQLNKIDDIDVKHYLHWAKPLDKAFSNNDLNGTWGTFIQLIDDHVINYLSITSNFLSLSMPEQILSDSNLDDILNNARALIDNVKDSDLPKGVKEYMIKSYSYA